MRIEDLTVALRPRTAWEALELGSALVRRHAGAIWRPWLWLTLPLYAALNALAWALDAMWLAPVLMWWALPLFDRIPLYVLSRAVFGGAPGPGQTLRAQRNWGARWWLAYLTWRRLGPVRSLYLPIDLLEGGDPATAKQRRSALGSPVYAIAFLLTAICSAFILALVVGLGAGVLMFVPNDYLPDGLRIIGNAVTERPLWFDLTVNVFYWAAVSAIEPFFVGAGFGLYLNRRIEVEGWDIEMAFRRLRARLSAAAPGLLALCLALGASAWMPDVSAQASRSAPLREVESGRSGFETDTPLPPTLREVFGTVPDDRSLREAVERAEQDATMAPKAVIERWQMNEPQDARAEAAPLAVLGRILSLIGEYGLWFVVAGLVLVLLITAPRWLKWFGGADRTTREREAAPVRTHEAAVAVPLPDDIPTAVRTLWRAGRERDALALLYRASVEVMSVRANVTLVPGATEAHCLRASRQMPSAEDRDAFAQAVRTWQYAAYAQHLPAPAEFDALLSTLSRRFGWSA